MKVIAVAVFLLACGHQEEARRDPAEPEAPNGAKLVVTSDEFAAGADIPFDHTCEGTNIAPGLAWSGAPADTKSFALIVDDPDAPKSTWVHWVMVDIPATVTSLPAGAGITPPDGAKNGKNDFGNLAWGGPCPPTGKHRYYFKVFALDTTLGKAGMTKADVLAAIKGHVLARGELMGKYEKQKH